MKLPSTIFSLSAALVALTLGSTLLAEESKPSSELFEKLRLVYEDDFDGELNLDFWEVRQSSTWEIKDGILTGSESSEEFQAKKIAEGDKAHAGFKPVIWLKQVPENFVCRMRMRYNAEEYHPKFPLLDLGHHIHTLVFGEDVTTLFIKKKVQVMTVEEQFLPLNEWVDVTIELKKGTIFLKMNDKSHRFESSEIDMTGHAQIDFKGVDFGTCEIDHIKVWEGLQ